MARKDIFRRFEVRINNEVIALELEDLKKEWFPDSDYADNKVINKLIHDWRATGAHVKSLEALNQELEFKLSKAMEDKKLAQRAWIEQKANYDKVLSRALNLEKDRQSFLNAAQDLLKFQG